MNIAITLLGDFRAGWHDAVFFSCFSPKRRIRLEPSVNVMYCVGVSTLVGGGSSEQLKDPSGCRDGRTISGRSVGWLVGFKDLVFDLTNGNQPSWFQYPMQVKNKSIILFDMEHNVSARDIVE